MYGWIWRKIPGGIPGKLLGSAALLAAVLALLFLVVFPWAGPKLPFNHVTVNGSTITPAPNTTSTMPAVPD
jgi:hypothetical protein